MLLAIVWSTFLRRWGILALFLAGILLMGAASFPWVKHVAYGPLAGFRWTFKLSLLFGPLGLVVLLHHLRTRNHPRRLAMISVSLMAILSLVVCLKGVAFDLIPPQQRTQGLGIDALSQETEHFLRFTGVPPGGRIALTARVGTRWPVPFHGLTGNAPLLIGYETISLYEPLEPDSIAQGHLGMSVPWRIALTADQYHQNPLEWERRLEGLGAQLLVTGDPDFFVGRPPGVFKDSLGRKTYFKTLHPTTPNPFPWVQGVPPIALHRLPTGALETIDPMNNPPGILSGGRTPRWIHLPDGRWRGEFPIFPPGWFTLQILIMGLTLLIHLFWSRVSSHRMTKHVTSLSN